MKLWIQDQLMLNRLKLDLHTVFPQYLSVFSNITGVTSLMILREYPTPDKLLCGHRKTMINKIMKSSRKGEVKSTEKYNKLIAADEASKKFNASIDSIYFNIFIILDIIEMLEKQTTALLQRMQLLIEEHGNEKIFYLKSIPF